MGLRRSRRRPRVTLERQPDGLPKTGLFTEPIRVTRLDGQPPEPLGDDRYRTAFVVEVRDADGRRCSDVAIEAVVSGPERTARALGTTDLLGRIRFRMAGPSGRYAIELSDVGAGGLAWAADAGPRTASIEVPAPT